MKYILLNKSQLHGKGRYGLYFRISQRQGVKIAKATGFKKMPDLNKASVQKTIQEATIGILANSPTKKLVLAKYNGMFYVGILQRHIISKNKYLSFNEVSKIKSQLRKSKVVHSDIRPSHNALATRKGIVVIDFDPDFSYFVGKKSHYYTIKNRLIKKLKHEFKMGEKHGNTN